MNVQIQKAHVPRRINRRKPTPRLITGKLQNTKDIKTILKVSEGKIDRVSIKG